MSEGRDDARRARPAPFAPLPLQPLPPVRREQPAQGDSDPTANLATAATRPAGSTPDVGVSAGGVLL